jgi:hypothetical protein
MRMHSRDTRNLVRTGDASFARSFDPRTSILTTHRGRNPWWWGGRGGITVGQTRASGRNQHWGHHERTECGSPRVRGLARDRSWHEVKDGGRGLPPCEDARARVWLLARLLLLQKSVGDVWPRISSANALQKERQGRVNRGLAACSRRWVKPAAGTWGETTNRTSTSPLARARIGVRLRVVRDLHSAVATSERVLRSWDRGCNGHWILRRVPTGGRHPGHHEASAFTRRRGRWPWRFRHPPTRTNPAKTRTYGQIAALAKAREA